MTVAVFSAREVHAAVSPAEAYDAVRSAFVAYARGEWSMPPKVYVPAYPAGDFRAMPVLGAGHAALKWVTSFPGNPARGLPTVTGLVLLSDASDGSLVAVLDAAAVTALRTGAAAVLAAETLARADAGVAAVVGAADLGAGPWSRFWRVTVPLSVPGALATFFMVFIPTVGEYVTPSLVGGTDGIMYGNIIQGFFTRSANWPLGSAMALIM